MIQITLESVNMTVIKRDLGYNEWSSAQLNLVNNHSENHLSNITDVLFIECIPIAIAQ